MKKQKPIIVLIDDFKPAKWYGVEETARVFKNAQKGYDFCRKQTHIDELYLDYDLGDGMKGGDILEYLVENDHVTIGRLIIISLNSVGIARMKAFCRNHSIPCIIGHPPKELIIEGQSG